MVASPPDKWMWDVYEEFKFRIKDIRSFKVNKTSNDNEYVIIVQLDDKRIVPIKRGENGKWCQDWVDNFIKENL